ncbi:hypothetical protein Tco_0433099 [Tanacetum coccineum]
MCRCDLIECNFDVGNQKLSHRDIDYAQVLQKLIDEIGELRAISGHMLGAAGVQILEDNLDDLHSSREEDGTLETMDPEEWTGFELLAVTYLT